MTVQDIITYSLRLLGELPPGCNPNPEESLTAMEVLNAMLDNWTIQHRKVYVIDNKQFPLASGKQCYTMGPGGEFDTERPVKIQRANIIYDKSDTLNETQGIFKKLEIVNGRQWAAIPEKSMQACEPLKLYNDNQFPLINLCVWPIPKCPC